MAHRQFRDALGRLWDAWSVYPDRAERRLGERTAVATERRQRKADEFRVPLSPQWINGWLAFETKGEKRRLAPVPDGWDALPDEELDRLRERAIMIPRPPRRLAE